MFRFCGFFGVRPPWKNLWNSCEWMEEQLDSADQLSKIPITELLAVEMLLPTR
jgi:hypothetical protein